MASRYNADQQAAWYEDTGVTPGGVGDPFGGVAAAPAPVAPPPAAPTSVEDLYRTILGREPEAEGLAFWQQGFGDTIDPAEVASFKQAAQAELANRTPAEQQALAPKLVNVPAAVTPPQDIVEAATANQNAVQTPPAAPTPIDLLTKQILGQNLTSKWTGEGFGSAEKNAADMAKILADTGITNIKDFGKITQYAPVEVMRQTYNGEQVRTVDNGDGTTSNVIVKGTGQYDGDGNEITTTVAVPKNAKLETVYGRDDGTGELSAIDPSKIITKDGKPVVATGETFGNTKTGQTVANTYSERQTGNAFGGTFAGKGNTGYRVQFAPDGTPIFYTTGASSNDLLNILQDNPLLNAVANVAATYFGGPAGVAALQAAQGKDLGDIAKAAALSYLGGQAGNFVSGLDGITDVLGDTGTKIAANATKQFVGSGGKLDPVDALLASAGGAGLSEVLSQIPDFDTFDPALQGIITKTVLNELLNSGGGSSGGTSSGTSGGTATKTTGGTKPQTVTGGASTSNAATTIADTLGGTTTAKEIADIIGSTATPKTTTGGTKTSTASTGGSGTSRSVATPSSTTSATTIASLLPALLGATATPTAKTTTTAKTADPVTDAVAALAQQQNPQAALLNLMSSSKDELAKIKSYKDLYGHELFEDNYVPPSAGGSEEEFFNGGHVDDLSVDALLHILRN